MDNYLGGQRRPQGPTSRLRDYLRLLIVAGAVLAALFLTVTRPAGEALLRFSRHAESNAPERAPKNYDLSALRVFTTVLGKVKSSYVDPQRLMPKQMLLAALNGIEKSVAEVLIIESPDHERIKVRVQDKEQDFVISDVDSPWTLTSRMKQIVGFLRPNLNPATDIRDVEYSAINGLLSTLDPHSVLLKPDIYNEMKLSTRGEFGGLGIVISMVNGVLTVMKPMKGTPASTMGVKSCDQILKIGEESTVNMTLTQAVRRLRGAPGSTVEITFTRGGLSQPTKKTLTRAVIKVDSVSSRLLAKRVGYLRLSSFQGNSVADVREHLRQLKRNGMKALIMDLRGNPGGLLDQAVKISDLFVESGTLVATVGIAGKRREEKRATKEGTEPRYPMAVLVNSGSASASEIVAGALKNLDRAIIIGTQTFGKGSVQVLYDMDDGSALKLTIAQYLTPGDVSIQSVGIAPDFKTLPVVVSKDFINLTRREHFPRERDLRQHLTHGNASDNEKASLVLSYLVDPQRKEKEKEKRPSKEPENLCLYPDRSCTPEDDDKFAEDFQIRLARDLLASAKGWRRTQLIKHAGPLAKKAQEKEIARVAEALRQLGVDWSEGAVDGMAKSEGKPKLFVTVSTSPRGKVKACQKVTLKVTARNGGDAPAFRLLAESKSSNKILSEHEFVFGRLDPGATRSWTVPINVRDAPTRVDDLKLVFTDAAGSKYPPVSMRMPTQGVERPVFAYGYQLIDDIRGNLDGKAQRGEQLRLFVKVKNTGKGPALKAVTNVKNLSGVGIFVRKGRFVLGRMEPGQVKTASFSLDVQSVYQPSSFKVELSVLDDGLREFVVDKLKFSVADDGPGVKPAKGIVRIGAAQAEFRAWAAADADVVGHSVRGTAFKVLGRLPGWYRVQVAPTRIAFVAEGMVTPGAGRPTARGFISRWQVTPPKVVLTVAAQETDKESILVEGVASDETRVSDVFIFVRNPKAKIEARKVFYGSNRQNKNAKTLAFSAKVPLWSGTNYITVFARENEQVQTQEQLIIHRREKVAELVELGTKPAKEPEKNRAR
jgi:carboxyl-terminal processing protease